MGSISPTKRRPNICDSFSAMMPLFSREKSSLKGRWRLETVQGMRSSGSNPVSCSETSIKIYGSKEEIRARKSPETVDAPGFAPDASIPVILYGPSDRIRTCGILLPKQARYQLRYTRLFSFLSGWSYSPKPGAIPASLYPDMRVSADKHFAIIAKAAGECKHFLILKKN